MSRRTLTLQEIYRKGSRILEEALIPEASLDAWLLLSYVTGKIKSTYPTKIAILTNPSITVRI